MFGISMWELLLVALLLFVLVGPKKLPEVAKTLAQALAKLRRSVDDMKKEVDLDEELSFIKEVRSFSPERLLEDTEPKRPVDASMEPVEPVEPPRGPEDKKPLRSRKKKVASGKETPFLKKGEKQGSPGEKKRRQVVRPLSKDRASREDRGKTRDANNNGEPRKVS